MTAILFCNEQRFEDFKDFEPTDDKDYTIRLVSRHTKNFVFKGATVPQPA